MNTEHLCNVCGLLKPVTDFYVRKESGKLRNQCKTCLNLTSSKWGKENPEKRRAVALKWAKNNYPSIYANKARYRAQDPLRMRRWSIENPERMQALRDRWDAANKDRKAEHAATRRARNKLAMPSWANRFFIGEAYRLAKLRTATLGSRWEVDHIVPLQGKTVCGLHVEHNLQVIPMNANRVKGHHWWPGKP